METVPLAPHAWTPTSVQLAAVGTAPAERVVGHTFDAGTGGEVSVGELGELVGLIGMLMVTTLEDRGDAQRIGPADSEAMRLVREVSRLRAATGWAPAHTLEDGLGHTIDFFRDPARHKTDRYHV
ncbi:hypothetical protein [Streptomyces buecherae]|uniref:NAD-dependent epimerase/dehydratase family protein n=1 Tax=Streptomyces buecherae TaxID=2763006 RepID=A0A7H8N1T3_9ACTN|nr:hypothetical protein [Streptomyces buecherae]QKW48470.1 hypothetical protein HUT08_01705 [Streptomyces buecherae]